MKQDAVQIIEILLLIREKEKLIGTYYDGFSELIHPDGMIRGSIGHVGTETGRTNSSKPNLQNIPRNK